MHERNEIHPQNQPKAPKTRRALNYQELKRIPVKLSLHLRATSGKAKTQHTHRAEPGHGIPGGGGARWVGGAREPRGEAATTSTDLAAEDFGESDDSSFLQPVALCSTASPNFGQVLQSLGNGRYCPLENAAVPGGHACFLFVGLREPGCISYL